jgi:transcriptional regulator with XRE-family HTH domain
VFNGVKGFLRKYFLNKNITCIRIKTDMAKSNTSKKSTSQSNDKSNKPKRGPKLTAVGTTEENRFGKWIADKMEEKGYSLGDVYRRSGGEIDPGHLSQIRRGKETNPTPRKMEAIARGLEIPVINVYRAWLGLPEENQGWNEMELKLIDEKLKNLDPHQRAQAEVLINSLRRMINEFLGI